MAALVILSVAIGWLYTFLWSLSFWPQVILNWRRKSVQGFSQDFAHLNVVGFLCYTLYNLAFLTSREIQAQYKERHDGNANVVRVNDLVFAGHAFLLSSVQLGQSYYYASGGRASDTDATAPRTSAFARVSLLGIAIGVLVALFLALSNSFGLVLLDFVNLLSWVKLYITLVKYFPQISLNYRRKTTRGFSVANVVLDFTGGVLSFMQLAIDGGIINHDWSALYGDIGKL